MASSNSIHQVSFIIIKLLHVIPLIIKVTDVVLGGLVTKFDHIAVLFFSTKRDKEVIEDGFSDKIEVSNGDTFQMVKNLENIADDCAEDDISLVGCVKLYASLSRNLLLYQVFQGRLKFRPATVIGWIDNTSHKTQHKCLRDFEQIVENAYCCTLSGLIFYCATVDFES